MITLDADFADKDFLDLIRITCDFCSVIYSTHKHTPEKPKYRWTCPYKEEYHRKNTRQSLEGLQVLSEWNTSTTTTYQPARMMFWPSTSKDGEYICEQLGDRNAYLNPDDILAQYTETGMTSATGLALTETELRHSDIRHQEDPLSKSGWIGAFCRAYTIKKRLRSSYQRNTRRQRTRTAGPIRTDQQPEAWWFTTISMPTATTTQTQQGSSYATPMTL